MIDRDFKQGDSVTVTNEQSPYFGETGTVVCNGDIMTEIDIEGSRMCVYRGDLVRAVAALQDYLDVHKWAWNNIEDKPAFILDKVVSEDNKVLLDCLCVGDNTSIYIAPSDLSEAVVKSGDIKRADIGKEVQSIVTGDVGIITGINVRANAVYFCNNMYTTPQLAGDCFLSIDRCMPVGYSVNKK